MKKRTFAAMVVLSVFGLIPVGMSEPGFFIEGTGGLWMNPDMEGFRVIQGAGSETIDGQDSLIVNLKAGMNLAETNYVVDVAAVGGLWGNDAVGGLLFGVDSSVRFRLGKQPGAFAIGPHAGFNLFTGPQWRGSYDDAVDFDPTLGGQLGLKATLDGRKISYVLTLDYMVAEFEIDNEQGFANRDTLDMTGAVLQLGIQF